MVNGWKITAIIFIVLFVLETSYVVWAISSYIRESNFAEKMDNYCDYNVCGGSSEIVGAWEDSLWGYYDMDSNICRCNKGDRTIKEVFVEDVPLK